MLMEIKANNPLKKSWLFVDKNSDFPIQNIPFGVFITKEDIITIGTRIGNYVIDLAAFHQLGYFEGIPLTDDIFMQDSLNDFIADGRKTWRLVRNRISEVFDADNPLLRDNQKDRSIIIFDREEVEVLVPVDVGDFTDFSSSKTRAKTINTIYKGGKEELATSWFHAPVGYHGRSSSIVISGTPIHRPYGQIISKSKEGLELKKSEQLDMEVEIAFVATASNPLGHPISVDEAEENIFGVVLLNDWTARDMQNSEHNPLAPFLSKNFASTISPWIVTLDALQPFRCESVAKNYPLLPYLQEKNKNSNFDISLKTTVVANGKTTLLAKTNSKYLYWSISQQMAHHTINGCNIRSGDLLSSGTISDDTQNSYGSMLELTQNGKKPITLSDGTQRTFFKDKDTVIIEGYCKNNQVRIGFGRCMSVILPPVKTK